MLNILNFAQNVELNINLLFEIELIILILIVYKTLKEKNSEFDCVVITFFLLFFYIAPIIQIANNELPNTMKIDDYLVTISILYTSVFLLIYYIFRFHMNIRIKLYKEKSYKNIKNFIYYKYIKIVLMIVFAITFIPRIPKMLNSILGVDYVISTISEIDRIKNLIIYKCMYLLPTTVFAYDLYLAKLKNKKLNKISLLFGLFIVLLSKNFFLESRGVVAPVYLALIIFIYRKKLNAKRILILLISVFIIGYPVAEQIVHSNSNINIASFFNGQTSIGELFNIDYFSHFTKLDYDAWSNFMATIKYVKMNDFSYGNQLLGSILFFIPRSIWPNKPVATGEVIGKFLMKNTDMWFFNLSNPIISEGYVDFGIIGIILYAMILAITSKKIKKLIETDSYLSFVGIFMSMQMFIFLRGDMLSSISFVIAAIIGIYILPLSIDKLFKIINLCKK